jgi:hypothetical protein
MIRVANRISGKTEGLHPAIVGIGARALYNGAMHEAMQVVPNYAKSIT